MGILLLPYALLAWFILALACCQIARSKGLSVNGWGVLSLLFGPFALAGVLLANPDYTALEKGRARTGEMRRCPQCDELIRKAAIKCRYCGSEISRPKIAKSESDFVPPRPPARPRLLEGSLLDPGIRNLEDMERRKSHPD